MSSGTGPNPAASKGIMATRVPAVLVMHADLASALLRAAEQVTGPIEGVSVLSNEGLSGVELERRIGDAVSSWTAGGLVLTDFWGGSCHICGSAALRGRGGVVLITGINLPVLIDYLHNRDRFTVDDLAERLSRKGQESIRVQHGHAQ
jgi:mannose/fructose-specific phosphotransferase system component IIA